MGNVFRIGANGLEPIDKTILQRRQIVYLNGYNQDHYHHDRLAIFKIDENNMHYSVVNIDKPGPINLYDAYSIKEADGSGAIGIYYKEGEFATEEEIAAGLKNVDLFKSQKIAEEKAATERKAEEREKLLKKYNHLQPSGADIKSRILATKNIRTELKTAFPTVKFSITSESFSGGDSIHVGWNDGPTNKEVEEIIDKYQQGHFDGMNDIYEYSGNLFSSLFGGAKYVSGQRDISNERYIEAAKDFSLDISINDRFEFSGCDYEDRERICRRAREKSYYEKPSQIVEEHFECDGLNIKIRINEEKNGIEIIFSRRPEKNILDRLSGAGFRWSNFNKLWYHKNTPENLAFANELKLLINK